MPVGSKKAPKPQRRSKKDSDTIKLDSNEFKATAEELLLAAAREGNIEGIQAALENGANIDTKDSRGRTALSLAADNNQAALVERLIECGAKVDVKNNNGWTPLMQAAYWGYDEVSSSRLL